MKPAPFDYAAPTNLGEALALLTGGGADARPLAGGQSLVPAMAMIPFDDLEAFLESMQGFLADG